MGAAALKTPPDRGWGAMGTEKKINKVVLIQNIRITI
jgi:hypothetical protein